MRFDIGRDRRFATTAGSGPRRSTPARRRFRAIPEVLALEDRRLLSTFTVNSTADDGSTGTLRWAIDQANAASGASTIDFDATVFGTPQVINLDGSQLELSNTSGTETITGPAAGVVVNGGGLSRVLQVDSGVTASVSGLTITGGNVTSSFFSTERGGGAYNDGGTLTLTDCTISGNTDAGGAGGGLSSSGTLTLDRCEVTGNSAAAGGGLISGSGSTLTMNDSVIGDNSIELSGMGVGDGGGGLYNEGTAVLTDCTIVGNSIPGEMTMVHGGGVANTGTITLTSCTITGNSAGVGGSGGASGGGLINNNGTVNLLDCTITANTGGAALYSGGGLPNGSGGYTGGGTLTVSGCTISGNTGGGVTDIRGRMNLSTSTISQNQGLGVDTDGTTNLTDCTISGNTSTRAGGLYNNGNYQDTVTLTACTISGNSAGFMGGGGVYMGGGTLDLTDTIVAGNANSSGASDIVAPSLVAVTVEGSSNLIGTGGSGGLTTAGGNLLNVADPLLGPLADNGGPTETMALLAGSPAIGGGSAVSGVTADQRGLPIDATPDIGAYQTQAQASQPIGLSFTGLTDPSITYGTVGLTVSGVLSDGAQAPTGETVEVALNGVTQQATIGAGGAFSTTFDTSTLGVSGSPYTVSYSYVGDGTYAPISTTGSLTVTQATPALTVTDSGGTFSGTPFAAAVTLAGANGTVVPTLEGMSPTLAYYAGSTGTGTPLSGAPSAVGTYTAVASIPGSTDYTAATDSAIFTIASNAPALTFGGLSNPSITYGTASLTLSGTLSGGSQAPPDTESVSVTLGGVTMSAPFGPGGSFSATFDTAALNVAGSPYAITYSYAGDGTFAAASATGTLTVTPATPVLDVSAPGGRFDGGPFAASVTIAGAGADQTPSGSLEGVSPALTYYSGSGVTGTPLSGAPTAIGTYTVVASFPGSADYAAVTDSATFTIAPDAPALTFGGLSNPSITYGTASLTLSGTLSGGSQAPPETESVSVTLGGVTMSAPFGPGGSFSATFDTAALNVAGSPYAITYSYAGDGTFAAASATGTLTVTPATPVLNVSAPGGRFDGSPFAASVTIAGADQTPSGSLEGVSPALTYYSGSSATGTPLSGPPTAIGTYTVVASFPGSADYAATQSAPVTFTIGQDTPSVALSASGGSIVYGQSVSLVAAVTSAGGVPTGTVTFFADGTNLGTAALDGSGKAVLTTSALAVGSDAITATYNGDSQFSSATSTSMAESVAQAATEIVWVPHAIRKGKKVVSIQLVAKVERVAPGAGVAGGSVSFMYKKKSLGTAGLSGGQASVTLKAASVLNKPITVIYGGDPDDQSSTATFAALTPKSIKSLARSMIAPSRPFGR